MNLPLNVTPKELTEVLLNVAPIRPVFIWGAPGIGKSSLVEHDDRKVFSRHYAAIPWDVELARWFEERFPDLENLCQTQQKARSHAGYS